MFTKLYNILGKNEFVFGDFYLIVRDIFCCVDFIFLLKVGYFLLWLFCSAYTYVIFSTHLVFIIFSLDICNIIATVVFMTTKKISILYLISQSSATPLSVQWRGLCSVSKSIEPTYFWSVRCGFLYIGHSYNRESLPAVVFIAYM